MLVWFNSFLTFHLLVIFGHNFSFHVLLFVSSSCILDHDPFHVFFFVMIFFMFLSIVILFELLVVILVMCFYSLSIVILFELLVVILVMCFYSLCS
jgi:hypothetical protein